MNNIIMELLYYRTDRSNSANIRALKWLGKGYTENTAIQKFFNDALKAADITPEYKAIFIDNLTHLVTVSEIGEKYYICKEGVFRITNRVFRTIEPIIFRKKNL